METQPVTHFLKEEDFNLESGASGMLHSYKNAHEKSKEMVSESRDFSVVLFEQSGFPTFETPGRSF